MEEITDVQRQLASNDPKRARLAVSTIVGDWGRLRTYIGRNTTLKELDCSLLNGDEITKRDFNKFFRGVAYNRSIQKLLFDRCDLYGGEIFSILVTLF